MDEAYSRSYRTLYEHHWWWRAREEVVLEALRRLASHGGRERILDVGCGDGLFLPRLSAFGVAEGLEPLVPVSPDRNRFTIHHCLFDEHFAPDEPYSLVTMLDVLEHLPDRPAALRQVRRVLRLRGGALITVPAFRSLWTRHDDINHHLTRYTRAELESEVRLAGLEVLWCRYFFHWGFAAKLAVRLRETLAPSPPAPERVPPYPINRLLLGVSRAERRVVGNWDIPFGTSILLAARRLE